MTPLPKVLILSGYAGSGKDTLARHLEQDDYVNVKWAGALKQMLRSLLVYAGADPDVAYEATDGQAKGQTFSELGGQTPRYVMQTLGTEWGRQCMGDDFWVDLTIKRAQRLVRAGGRVVITDTRFPNEVAAAKKAFGDEAVAVRIVRKGVGPVNDHPSETSLDDYPFDMYVHNDGTIADFLLNSDAMLRDWGWARAGTQ